MEPSHQSQGLARGKHLPCSPQAIFANPSIPQSLTLFLVNLNKCVRHTHTQAYAHITAGDTQRQCDITVYVQENI